MSVDEFIRKTSVLKKRSDFSRFCLRVSLVPKLSPSFPSLAVWFYCQRQEAGEGLGSAASDGKLARAWVLRQVTGSWRGPGFYGKRREAGEGLGTRLLTTISKTLVSLTAGSLEA